MSADILILLAVLLGMIVCFLTEIISPDLAALLGLLILTLTGSIPTSEAFGGFSSNVVITIISTFVIGAGLKYTGVADGVAQYVFRLIGNSETLTVCAVMLIASFFSAFMNNVAATALLLPTVVSIASRTEIPLSRLLIPLAFGTILGGTSTLIGTPPNILASEALNAHHIKGFLFLDFTPIGVAIIGSGIAFMALIGRHLLPRNEARRKGNVRDLLGVYQLYERIFALKIPIGSSLHGQSVGVADLGAALAMQVVGIIRGGKQKLAPTPRDILRERDVLMCRGKVADVVDLLRFRGVGVESLEWQALPEIFDNLEEATVELARSDLVGKTLREIGFKQRFGAVVVEMERYGVTLRRDLGGEALSEGDRLKILGDKTKIEQIKLQTEFVVRDVKAIALSESQRRPFFVILPPHSPLSGVSISESRIDELLALLILRVERDGKLVDLSSDESLREGDKLLVVGESEQLEKLSRLGRIEVTDEVSESEFESDDIAMVEVVLAPRSKVINNTIKNIKFREKYGFQVLAIWRERRPFRSRVRDIPLQLGDALLLQGPRNKIAVLAEDPDFVVLADAVRAPARPAKAPWAIFGLVIMLVLSVFDILEVHIAACLGAAFVIFSGALTMEEMYREVEWKIVFFVGALLPIGIAFDRTGASGLVSAKFAYLVSDLGPFGLLVALSLAASFLSQVLDGAIAVILLSSITIQTANHIGVSPYPFMMAVALSASVAFMTPFSSKAGLLVMGAGGYKTRDYIRVGTPLSVIMFLMILLLVPFLFPF